MKNVMHSLLTKRAFRGKQSEKMDHLAQESAKGGLTSFSGVFQVTELSTHDKEALEALLFEFTHEETDLSEDLKTLISITSEVKAINHQAILLHGERIQQAQKVLKKYQEGAFSRWLKTTYGNRQTPYNFLQYTIFYQSLPDVLKTRLEAMPRQVVYSLASREGKMEEKLAIVEKYNGESKQQMLEKIRDSFPLNCADKRVESSRDRLILTLERLITQIQKKRKTLSHTQKGNLRILADSLLKSLSN